MYIYIYICMYIYIYTQIYIYVYRVSSRVRHQVTPTARRLPVTPGHVPRQVTSGKIPRIDSGDLFQMCTESTPKVDSALPQQCGSVFHDSPFQRNVEI